MVSPKITQVGACIAAPEFEPWTCCALAAGAVTHPDQLAGASAWLPAEVPGTAAVALEASGQWHVGEAHDFDAEDWWYRTTFAAPAAALHLRSGRARDGQIVAYASGAVPLRLNFEGLATLTEIWLNGRHLFTADNMFRAYRFDITPYLRDHNELVLGFRSLADELKKKRPRPRWKTKLVSHQQLRWQRTSLLGRIPGWSPPVAPVGPWRAVRLDTAPLAATDWRLLSRMQGDDGVVTLRGRLTSSAPIRNARLRVGDHDVAVQVQRDGEDWLCNGQLSISKPDLWWPHTHGVQPLFPCTVTITTNEAEYTIDCGKVGFRRLEVRRDDGFAIAVNGVPIYCRGACWTVHDIVRLESDSFGGDDLRLARDAGINMLRIPGTMTYQNARFHQRCDELGILVWQDFMFANMDYPIDDPAFAANIEAEAREQLARLASHPSLVVLCGNSEIEQQAAMLGMPRELWSNRWFGSRLGELCSEYSPDVCYVPSTPTGGVLPFHVRTGITHYYGIGAYQRTLAELRKADVKFSPECLGFSNIPEPETVNVVTEDAAPAAHSPRWKERVPRDAGPGWDFEDVRDFYLQQLFALDPVKLRSFDMARYLQLSRIVPGEMMSQVFAEWRGSHGRNQGGLVWFYKDLWPGAGWGIVDSLGVPKAAYYYLKRCWKSRQLTITDEGLDGLHLHAINESPEPFRGHVELILLQDGHIVTAQGRAACVLPPHGRQLLMADELLGGFYDVTYAYRFGPPKHNLAAATLFDEAGQVVSEAFFFLAPREPTYLADVKLEVRAEQGGPGRYQAHLQTDRFLHAVRLEAKGFLADDNYFHLLPGRPKKVTFTAVTDHEERFRANLEALNLRHPVMVRS